MSQLLFFSFAFKLVRIKNLEAVFWSHKPSPACCAKSELSTFGWSEPWVWCYKTPLNELWILLNYALGKAGESGQPNYSGPQPNRHFFSTPLEQMRYQGHVPAAPKHLRTAPCPAASRQALPPEHACSLSPTAALCG